ncbi:Peroxisomal targeting signal 2 receptor [Trichoplax sp. H2]|uniref:Peroxin-7 n=1 Tax=Trichoplax adhaerens TaxID=10228 RepID=B3RXR3_TRIAD|nr:hypothetical protein TRIADDRAFT_56300 [Trichoplax adhaerens]EDV24475.1 hypothetical protein TRIADDRAFT_56300 [Trichoplax adhaerens]RDD46814.1 Peroxisomal targeting signal 2 receptor [Trichoplax sp. H2]|eukprot:XP_002112365.1 hypothetical protein TRIADDRAFT_56300 [Trichoplax adhaerens]
MQYITQNRHGYSVDFSPYFADRIACVTGENFGIAGPGTLYIIDAQPQGLLLNKRLEWKSSLFDCCWSEINDNIIVTCSGDGSIQIWNISADNAPVAVMKDHLQEVYCVDWTKRRNAPQHVISASWDKDIKLWDPQKGICLATYSGHENVAYCATWSPHYLAMFASAAGDGTIRFWDCRTPSRCLKIINDGRGEILHCDWNKYNKDVIISCSTDNILRCWDLRNAKIPTITLPGHQYAVKKVKFSPHKENIVASCSYDLTVRLWNIALPNPMLEVIEHHSEFVTGLNFNLHRPGQIVDCAWDEHVKVYSPMSLQM